VAVLAALGVALCATACKRGQTGEAPSAPVVEVATVIQRDVPVYTEWTASTDGLVNATIRAQVQGYLITQDYREGDFVKKGQVLFEIDPRPSRPLLHRHRGSSPRPGRAGRTRRRIWSASNPWWNGGP